MGSHVSLGKCSPSAAMATYWDRHQAACEKGATSFGTTNITSLDPSDSRILKGVGFRVQSLGIRV